MINRFFRRDRAKAIQCKDWAWLIQAPVVTEKAFKVSSLSETETKSTFWVNPQATKEDIKQGFKALFDVTVLDVQTSVLKGKKKSFKRILGQRSVRKKAIVTLEKGQSIALESWSQAS